MAGTSKKQVDYIVVGQGIAGTVMAFTLLNRGHSVLVIDDPMLSAASKVAAGLYNPVVFKRLVKSWMADELIPVMDDFYEGMEKVLNASFYHKRRIVKLFAEENEQSFWLKKTNEDVGKYLSKEIDSNFLPAVVDAPLGASEVLHAGNLEMLKFLNASREHFEKKGLLMEEQFDYKSVVFAGSGDAEYKNILCKRIIFCEGYKSTENPYFSYLPFKLTKGETLIIQLAEGFEIPFDKVINKGAFILPLGNNTYKVGATYEWQELNELTTEKGKAELESKLKKVIKVPFTILEHSAGIRPTVNDRRPLLGIHPEHSSLAVFNGMGTKGVMHAPYFAQHFVDFLEGKTVLDKEIDINRFR